MKSQPQSTRPLGRSDDAMQDYLLQFDKRMSQEYAPGQNGSADMEPHEVTSSVAQELRAAFRADIHEFRVALEADRREFRAFLRSELKDFKAQVDDVKKTVVAQSRETRFWAAGLVVTLLLGLASLWLTTIADQRAEMRRDMDKQWNEIKAMQRPVEAAPQVPTK